MKCIKRFFVAVSVASVLTCHCFAYRSSAASVILMEQGSGRVLYENAADEESLIASITKIMTAVVALEHGRLDEKYTVTAEDMAEGSSMYLKPGENLTLEELLYGLMLSSGNDAALAVAHCVCGDISAFVDLMNETAAELGMEHSHFANPNGLDAQGHFSCARDMAGLASFALDNATFLRIASTSSVTINGRYLQNHNKLLSRYAGCIGVKTGFTKAAGRTLVSAAERDGMTLICVTLNDGDDWNDHMTLLDEGFALYTRATFLQGGDYVTEVPVRLGTDDTVKLIASADLCYPVTDGEKVTMHIRVPLSAAAPVTPGQVMGEAVLFLDEREAVSVDLIAAGTVGVADHGEEDMDRFGLQ